MRETDGKCRFDSRGRIGYDRLVKKTEEMRPVGRIYKSCGNLPHKENLSQICDRFFISGKQGKRDSNPHERFWRP